MIDELKFDLMLNSPAFVAEVQRGTKRVLYLKKGEPKEADPPYYPVDLRGIRIPSLRGVLEFWYRSLLGHLSSQEVYARQSAIFGSTDGGQRITIRPAGLPRFEQGKLVFEEGGAGPFPFLYLGYGPLQLLSIRSRNGRGGRENVATSHHAQEARDAILVGKEPRARFRFVARGSENQIAALRKALTLLHLFGGIGSRSRRGWGSLEVAMDRLEAPPANIPLGPWISGLLGSVWAPDGSSGASLPRFSALSQSTEIYVTEGFSSYEGVLVEFYEHFKRVRSYRQPAAPLGLQDHQWEVDDLARPRSASITEVPRRLAFGMPFQPGRKDVWEMHYRGRPAGATGTDDDVSRRASPLLLKVLRVGKTYAGVALFLKSEFFGDPRLEIGVVGKDLTQPFPGYEAIDKFFSSPRWQRVKLP